MNIEIKKIINKINKGEVTRGYKKTKVGIIPNEWQYDRFKNIVKKSQYGLSLAKNIKGNIKILDMSHLQNGHIINKDLGYVFITPDEYENYVIKKGDFLFNRTNSYDLVGKSAVAKKDYEFVFASYLVRFKFKEECNFQYIGEWFALSYKTNIIKRLATKGVSQCNINPTELQKFFYIPLPPLPEQQKIAEILSICDKVIELKEKLIEQKKLQKKYLMQAFLNPKIPNFRRLPGFDKDWGEIKLGECFTERRENNCTLRLLSITSEKGVIDRIEIGHKDNSNEDKSKYKVILKGDIGYNTMRMWQGVSGVSSLTGIVSPAYTVCKPKEEICPEFFGYLFKLQRVINVFHRYSQGLVNDTLSLKYAPFAKLKFPIPKYEEQKAIANVLSVVDKKIGLLEKEFEQQKLKKKALMQLLLTGKVRVNIA